MVNGSQKERRESLPLQCPSRIEICIFTARSNTTWQKSKSQLPKSENSAFCLAEAKSNILQKNGIFNPEGGFSARGKIFRGLKIQPEGLNIPFFSVEV